MTIQSADTGCMIHRYTFGLVATLLLGATPALAERSVGFDNSVGMSSEGELPAYLQCVPYAREQSGVGIYGDAHTWWDQADGQFERGNKPKVGAVMAFQPHRNMQLGHVAAVSKIIDQRTILLRHANWSPINGRRGQIEDDVKAVDVSPRNDWSQVRVWYDPIQNLGKTAWPIHGFIYSDKAPSFAKPHANRQQITRASVPSFQPQSTPKRISSKPSRGFTDAFASLEVQSVPAAAQLPKRHRAKTTSTSHRISQTAVRQTPAKPIRRSQPIASDTDAVILAISLYDN